MRFVFIVITIMVVIIGFYSWKFERFIHFEWSYKSRVEQVVRDMVKPEALKP